MTRADIIFDAICFENRSDAEKMLDQLRELINKYGAVSVADVFDLIGMRSNVIDLKFGWTDLSNASVNDLGEGVGYGLNIPDPIDFNSEEKVYCHPKHTSKKRVVNHPDHYQTEIGLEAIDVMEAFTEDMIGAEAFLTATVLKYLLRWKKKNGVEDLKKARWYLNRLIRKMEKEGSHI